LSNPEISPGPEPNRWLAALRSTAKAVGALVLVAAISAGAAYGVFEWRIRQEQADTRAEVAAFRQDFRKQQDDLSARVDQVEKAATEARLLLNQDGNVTSLDAKLKEIDTLKLELQKAREETNAKFQSMEQSVAEQVAKQGKETAQALAVEMQWKNLIIKAQGEVLLAQVHWAEGNRGLAKDELTTAGKSLQQALEAAPERNKTPIRQAVDLAEQTKAALIMEQSSARDSLNLLWHRTNDLLAPTAQTQP
jgi:hypothetical protein